MVQTMHMAAKCLGESIVEMHGCPARDHVHIGAAQNLQAFRNEVSNSHGMDSGVELGVVQ
jgi:hypothetical protein